MRPVTRLPSELLHCAQKLNGWSLEVSAYFGRNHTLTRAVANGVRELVPALQALSNYFRSPSGALHMTLRVMFQAQQMTFQWMCCRRSTAHGTAVPAPDYSQVVLDVEAFLLSGIPEFPVAWNNLIREEDNVRRREPDHIHGGAGAFGGDTQNRRATNHRGQQSGT